jgi:hypothetical protein
MIVILLVILIIVILCFIYYTKYYKEDYHYIEYSAKFSTHKPYDDNRKLYAFDMTKDIDLDKQFKRYNVDNKLIDFYNKLFKKMDKNEFALAFGANGISKLYINNYNEIYGIEKSKNDYTIRVYKPDEFFKKPELDRFVGLERSTTLYNLFNLEEEIVVYKKYDQKTDFNLNFYLIAIEKYLINDYREQIVTLLKAFKCKTDNIDVWLNKYSDYYLYWIAIGKKEETIELTFYYRIK